MGKWFHSKTSKLAYKSISFGEMVRLAEARWGYKAPQQEHLEGRIKSRDAARKKNRVVKWVRDALDMDS